MPDKKTKLTKKKDTTIIKTEVHVKAYDRKPFETKKKKKVTPKRTKAHNRLLGSIGKLSKDIARDIQKDKERAKAEKKLAEKRLIENKKKQIALSEGEKDLKARLAINELKRQQAVLEERNRLAAKKYEGLTELDEFRRERIPVALGSPASQKIAAMKTRKIYEGFKSDIITDRAKAFQEIAKVAKTRADAALAIGQARQAVIAAQSGQLTAQTAAKAERRAALKQLEAQTAIGLPKTFAILQGAHKGAANTANLISEAVTSSEKMAKQKELNAKINEEAKKRGFPEGTPLVDIISSQKEIRRIREEAKKGKALAKYKSETSPEGNKDEITVLKAQISTLDKYLKAQKEGRIAAPQPEIDTTEQETLETKNELEKQMAVFGLKPEKEGVRNPAYN